MDILVLVVLALMVLSLPLALRIRRKRLQALDNAVREFSLDFEEFVARAEQALERRVTSEADTQAPSVRWLFPESFDSERFFRRLRCLLLEEEAAAIMRRVSEVREPWLPVLEAVTDDTVTLFLITGGRRMSLSEVKAFQALTETWGLGRTPYGACKPRSAKDVSAPAARFAPSKVGYAFP